jgi:hypothetical protein
VQCPNGDGPTSAWIFTAAGRYARRFATYLVGGLQVIQVAQQEVEIIVRICIVVGEWLRLELSFRLRGGHGINGVPLVGR